MVMLFPFQTGFLLMNVVGMDTHSLLTKVFVGGLAWETPREAPRDHFQKYYEITEAAIISEPTAIWLLLARVARNTVPIHLLAIKMVDRGMPQLQPHQPIMCSGIIRWGHLLHPSIIIMTVLYMGIHPPILELT